MRSGEKDTYRELYSATADEFAATPEAPVTVEQPKDMKGDLSRLMADYINSAPDVQQQMARFWEVNEMLEKLYRTIR